MRKQGQMWYIQYARLRMAVDTLAQGDLVFCAPGVDHGTPLATVSELNRTILNHPDCRIAQADWAFAGVVAAAQPEISRGYLALEGPRDAQCPRVRIPFLHGQWYSQLHVGYPLLLATVRRTAERDMTQWAIVPVSAVTDHKTSITLDGHKWDIVRLHHIATVAGGIYRSACDSAILFSVKGCGGTEKPPSCGNQRRGQIPVVTEDADFLRYTNDTYRNQLASVSVWIE